jgi:GH35 family endo-1,4-beta-xylanase
MKIKNIITVFLVTFILVSCVPVAKVVPTKITNPTLTITPIPPTPTITSTPEPENIANAKNLPNWVGNYAQAFDGKVSINGVQMDEVQLLNAIRSNPESFIQTKTGKNQTVYNLLVINKVPLAIMNSDNRWRDILLRDMAEANNQVISSPVWDELIDPNDPHYSKYTELLKQVNLLTITADLNISVVFNDFSVRDWKEILFNWDEIKSQLNSGVIPDKYPYNWTPAEKIYEFAAENNMAVRVQHLLDGNDFTEAIKNGGFTKDELMKILEFETSVKVLKFKGQTYSWNVADEMVLTEINKAGNGDYGFWNREVNLDEAVLLIAKTVKKHDPKVLTVFTENFVLEKTFREAEPDHREQFFIFLKRMKEANVPIDCVELENNWWIHTMSEKEFMLEVHQKILDMGFCIASPETTVFISDYYPTWWIQPDKAQITDTPIIEQMKAYRTVAEVYTELPTMGMGLGEIWDKTSWLNFVTGNGNFEEVSDTYASIFNVEGNPKPAYYAILEVLYSAAFASQ